MWNIYISQKILWCRKIKGGYAASKFPWKTLPWHRGGTCHGAIVQVLCVYLWSFGGGIFLRHLTGLWPTQEMLFNWGVIAILKILLLIILNTETKVIISIDSWAALIVQLRTCQCVTVSLEIINLLYCQCIGETLTCCSNNFVSRLCLLIFLHNFYLEEISMSKTYPGQQFPWTGNTLVGVRKKPAHLFLKQQPRRRGLGSQTMRPN